MYDPMADLIKGTIETLMTYGVVIWLAWYVWTRWVRNPRVKMNTPAVRAVLNHSDYRWDEVLRARGGQFHIDRRGSVAVLSPHHEPRIIDARDVVEFGFDPLLSRTGHHMGWRFRVVTNDPVNPISWVDMDGTNLAEARTWMAKLNAVIGDTRQTSDEGQSVAA